MLCDLVFVWAALRCAFELLVWILESGKNQTLKLLCIHRNGPQHLYMLLGCLRRIMLHWPCIWGWLCASAQIQLVLMLGLCKSRMSFTIKYLTFWSDQLCFSAGWKFALNLLSPGISPLCWCSETNLQQFKKCFYSCFQCSSCTLSSLFTEKQAVRKCF